MRYRPIQRQPGADLREWGGGDTWLYVGTQNLKRHICKIQCRCMEYLMEIQKSAESVLPPVNAQRIRV